MLWGRRFLVFLLVVCLGLFQVCSLGCGIVVGRPFVVRVLFRLSSILFLEILVFLLLFLFEGLLVLVVFLVFLVLQVCVGFGLVVLLV